MSAPRKAPTIPPQKRSGRKIVKCQIARPIITQASIPMALAPPVPLVARPSWLVVAGVAVLLEDELVRSEVRRRISRRGRGGRAVDPEIRDERLELLRRDAER